MINEAIMPSLPITSNFDISLDQPTSQPSSSQAIISNKHKELINDYFDTADASDAGDSPTELTDGDSDFEGDSDSYSPPTMPLYPFQNQVGGHASLLRFSAKAVCKPLMQHEKDMYEHFEELHPEILPFISSYLGVLNVTFSNHNNKVIPEVQFEKNRHILPDNLLKRFLGSESPETRIESPGVTKVNKKLQEQIFLEAYSPSSLRNRLKDLCLKKTMRKRKQPRRRHSFDESIPENISKSKSPLMRVKNSDIRLGSSFDDRPPYDTSDEETSATNVDVDCLELPIQRHPINASTSKAMMLDDDSVVFQMEDLDLNPEPTETAEIARDSTHLNPWSMEIYRSTMDKMASDSSSNKIHQFLLLNDLTYNMRFPCVLDLKMGTRQYGIYATKEKRDSQMKKCEKSTSKTLGVRVCGMQIYKGKLQKYIYHDKYYGRKLSTKSFTQSLIDYLHDGEKLLVHLLPNLIFKLRKLFDVMRGMNGYRLYASSLLLLYDGDQSSPAHNQIDIKIIDFANCVHPAMHLDHFGETGSKYPIPSYPPSSPGTDHGYLRGLATLLQEFAELWYLHASPEQQQLHHHEILVDHQYEDAY